MNLLLLSNGGKKSSKLLGYALSDIIKFIGPSVTEILFVPYARVLMNWDDYTKQIEDSFSSTYYKIKPIHKEKDAVGAIFQAECILVGGGNTFNLLYHLNELKLMEPIRQQINLGVKYVSWSAGSNIASPTIKTTNDMPIIEPGSLNALNVIPFQINPHFVDVNVGQPGEAREQRLKEYLALNSNSKVLCLRNGSYVSITGDKVIFHGTFATRYYDFKKHIEIEPGTTLSLKSMC